MFSTDTLRQSFIDLTARLRGNGFPRQYGADSSPLRSELFSSDQMKLHGKSLASAHEVATGPAPDRLLGRLDENARVLAGTCRLLTTAVKANRWISPAGEWLLDNYYLVDEQIRIAKRHLPKSYSRELPRLLSGASAGLPRVYDIALETISHGDGRIDLSSLSESVAAYQTVTPLKLGELWAIPIMLRLALIENLRRVGARIATATLGRNLSAFWADQMIEIAERDPKSLILVIADMARSNPPTTSSFVAEFARRLQGHTPTLALPLNWIEQRLAEDALTIEQLVQSENQQQAADQVSISNSIGSLRALSSMDWREFVETMSVVEHKLREDPAGVYGKMDFATRDRYRHVIERVAKTTDLAEGEVARRAIQLAHQGAVATVVDQRAAHVGYYLVDKGLAQLEAAAQARLPAATAVSRTFRRFALLLYLGAIALFTILASLGMLAVAHAHGVHGLRLGLIGALALLCSSHLAVALVNWLATWLAAPQLLPRLDYSAGIPAEARTLVVIPTMLAGAEKIQQLVAGLEVRFLANRQAHLHFGLLTDFVDAPTQAAPEDDALLRLACESIAALNEKYPGTDGDNFYLFHRPRRWNAAERSWMGYERKRGKLADLNALLRGDRGDRFSHIVGAAEILTNVKYVITLDTDTQLPRDAARQLVGSIAHPLNRARYDERRAIVTEGYAILQPRVSASLPGAQRSYYARVLGAEPGIDPYTRAVSDVYQDVLGEGSFVGKGIYDVDAFECALGGRFPENRILSHDLLEGCYARSGLLSDVEVYEEHPTRYSADVSRRHRWVRGDWQIAHWLLPRVPGATAASLTNPLSGLSLWKIFDNLRRSLVPPALILMLLVGWTALSPLWFWTLATLAIIALPALIDVLVETLRKPAEAPLRAHLTSSARSAARRLGQLGFILACLPHEACYNLDAILRTTGRMLFTRRHLLEWVASSELERDTRTDLAGTWIQMWSAPALALAGALGLAFWRPAALLPASPVLLLWFVAPALAWWLSRSLPPRAARLSFEDTEFLHKLARKTWSFFERFVGADDHWLPPDNYQEHPVAVIAHRTSPTNMGLALLSTLAAHDFGYICSGQLIARISKTLDTMAGLQRYRGHFYNWYDTQSLAPLPPAYVSSVDSGNLAGYLLTLRPGLLAVADLPIIGQHTFQGLADTVRVLSECASSEPDHLTQLRKDMESAYDSHPATLGAARTWLERLAHSAAGLLQRLPAAESETKWWTEALSRQCQEALDDLDLLAPWTAQSQSLASARGATALERIPTLRELATIDADLATAPEAGAMPPDLAVSGEIRRLLGLGSEQAAQRLAILERLARQAGEFAVFEYDFLFEKGRQLLAIGYNAAEHRRDASYYDLLASEARLCSFVAIAQGQLPQEHWFAMGRLLASAGAEPVLLSWGGSMFEYLMPLLIMPTYEGTLLDHSGKVAVERQIEYGHSRGVPWGISESGYNSIDASLNYQYRAFGVPGLGLKRGLADDLVIAPYASALALMVAPEQACANLQRMAAAGFEGACGFYEAIDYTAGRVPRGQTHAVVRSFMAHHQGMSLLALDYLLHGRPMQRRFDSDPLFQATLLLLQERVPKTAVPFMPAEQLSVPRAGEVAQESSVRVFSSPHTPIPEVHLLSNGRYHVMVTNAGGGYSRWKDLDVTRWREDSTCDNWGTFCYIREPGSGKFWSTSYQPTLEKTERYEAVFSEARAEFRCSERGFDTHTEIAVSPEDDIELRRITITNRARYRRAVELTSYAEVVLAPSAADALHPQFSNLFVQTEIVRERRAVLCTRRPRSPDEHVPWMFHLLAVHDAEIGDISYETDRMRFIGRENTVTNPRAMLGNSALSGTQGSVLDPIVAIRYRIILDGDAAATIDMVTGVGDSREACLNLIERYQDRRLADRVFDLAWTHGQVVLRQINASEGDAQLYRRLASSIIYANSSLRADPSVISKNQRAQSGLWGYSISGDLPIVLLQISDPAHIELARQLVQAHAYWRLKGLAADLLIWNEDHAGYRQLLHDQITGLITARTEANVGGRHGEILARVAEQIPTEDRVLMQAIARVVISDRRGTLADQINERGREEVKVPRLAPPRARATERSTPQPPARRELIFFNGIGGFTPDGREYVITTTPGQPTPMPWVNVLANAQFGTVVSESGLAYTWWENAHEFRLTPWDSDPVSDSRGEAMFIRDEDSGQFWSPTPLPVRGATPYVSRHGFGYSVFEHNENGITSEVWIYVARDAPVKFTTVKLRNHSGRPRRLSVTGYVEWTLGDLRPKTGMHIVTEIDAQSGALFARNRYSMEFPGQVAFFDVDEATRSWTGDRSEFLGRNGAAKNPAAMTRTRLSNRGGAALDPCGALQVSVELAPGQERSINFILGTGRNATEASQLAQRHRGSVAARTALEKVWQYWTHALGAINVETPDPAVNVLANGWLAYQTLSCRLWARSGYYQSGGAFGFRDQLQDVMALIHTEPALFRDHLLRCAGHQFLEGDVQHWWHPPQGRGVRTHCSDDFLWLPLAVSRYVTGTGDTGVLDEISHFIEGRQVNADEESYYDLPMRSDTRATLYEHCVRAILRGLAKGEHGLPLIGTGDWNDGMNMIGQHGRGESVWLGFFLYQVLTRFAEVARVRGDQAFAQRCHDEAAALQRNIEQHAWDGAWYRRAYFDDGTPLGSAVNAECRIDSISQSWAVLSGAGEPGRARAAMEAVEQQLVHPAHGLIQLLDPPFDKSDLNPGYIKGYVPGVRENGGQYTHAAIWTVMAFAALGDNQRAWKLFNMINPVRHGQSAEAIASYKVEPYVVAADVYAAAPHTGRGGWTWYTGSAGWMYRLIIESLLGLSLEVDKLRLTPCLPADWKELKLHYRYRETVYHIAMARSATATPSLSVDGVVQPESAIPLRDDRKEHAVEFWF